MAGPRQMVILNNDLFRHLQTESTWVAHTHLSNSTAYWGSGKHMNDKITIKLIDKKTTTCEINITIPALSLLIFR